MEEITSYIDIERLINKRCDRHRHLMKDLDAVMEVLSSFCIQAEWMMMHNYRIGELIGEVVVASTEVEHILPRTKQYYNEFQRMLLPAIERQFPKDFEKTMRMVKGIIPQLKPYCDQIVNDKDGLVDARRGEMELTEQFNDKFITYYGNAIENLAASVGLLERHIVDANKIYASISDDSMKMNFDTMFRQYYSDKTNELKEYITEIEDVQIAEQDLMSTHQSSEIIRLYHQYERNPELMIRVLREENKKERCLMEIFFFKARKECLKKLKEASKAPIRHEGDDDQPENIIFIKYHDRKIIDFFTIRKTIELKVVDEIKFKYEWYAPYRILDDLNLLSDNKLASFAYQMRKWFPDAKVRCDADALGVYATGHTSKRYQLWDEETFNVEKKKDQTINGFRKLNNLCNEIKDALQNVPTLVPRQQ